MFNIDNPLSFTSAILVSSTMLIAACTALLIGFVFNKPVLEFRQFKKAREIRKSIYILFLVSFFSGTITIIFAIICNILSSDSFLISQLNILWYAFAIQFGSFISLIFILIFTFLDSFYRSRKEMT